MGIVTLVSGGFDSTLMSMMAQEEGIVLFPLFIDYGQRGATKEWEACQRLHEMYKLPRVVRMDLSGFGNTIPSGITDPNLRINEDAFCPAGISCFCWPVQRTRSKYRQIVLPWAYWTRRTTFSRIKPRSLSRKARG